jgi:phosphate transport system protein
MAGQIPREKLQQLEEKVLSLGNLVEGLLIEAADLLRDGDLDAQERLNDEGRQVHRKRLAIEMGCLSQIASQRPQGSELRPLVAMVEISAELERIGEHARSVARTNCLTADHRLRRPLASVHRLATEVQSLLDGALAAFARWDSNAARAVAPAIARVEGRYQEVRQELLTVMKSRPRIANQAIFLSRSAYSLRRAADRVASICEWVVFAVEGVLGPGDPASEVPTRLAEEASIALLGEPYDTPSL